MAQLLTGASGGGCSPESGPIQGKFHAILSIVLFGYLFSLVSTAFIADGGKKNFKAVVSEIDECADKESMTAPTVASPTLPAFTGPAKVTLTSLLVCVASTVMAFDKAAGISQRVFGTALTVASFLFAVQKTPAALTMFVHPVMLAGASICGGYMALLS